MKKILMNFSGTVLSRVQMKGIRGGLLDENGGEEYGSATRDCPDPIPDVTCTGKNGYTFDDSLGGGCSSDTEYKVCVAL